ncbi:PAS domain S-box protein, partial [Acidobacteria bacterium AH-259-A15]|nr:PAS domain S-box protein [Acidobacteria bacterium AH-259-A15]
MPIKKNELQAQITYRLIESLSTSEKRYQTLVENLQEIVFESDLEGTLKFMNSAWESTLGYSSKESLGRSIYDFVWVDDKKSCLKLFDFGKEQRPGRKQDILRFVHKKGHLLWVVVSIRADGEGNVFGSLHDITELRQTTVSKDYIDNILKSMIDTLIVMSPDGKIETLNRATVQLLGYKEEELMGKPVATIFEEEEVTYFKDIMVNKLIEEGSIRDYDMTYKTKSGEKIPVSLSASLLKDKNGDLISIICTAKDITERKRAEEERRKLQRQIQQSQKLESLGVLAGGIAHDFNNLLMGILGNADIALTELSPVSPARHGMKEIKTASKRAADLCRQLLAYAGKGQFVMEPIELHQVVEEMGHLLKISISKKAVLKYNFADSIPAIKADATEIGQVIMNLIFNASEAIGNKSGVITISVGAMQCDAAYLKGTWLAEPLPEGSYVYIEVSDTGSGMDSETVERIFDPFFTTKFAGRGLGLAGVLGIVRGHQGAIKVYSEPGKGTTFKVLFPAVDKPAKLLGKELAEAKDWRGSGTILLVDDEEMVRAVAKRMLEKAGFAVLTAGDGREALKLFREHSEEILCV